MSDPTKLLAHAAKSAAFSGRLSALGKGKGRGAGEAVVFDHVTPAAQAFVAGMVLEKALGKAGRAWILCDDLRTQERVLNELAIWWSREPLRFFPQLEAIGFGDVLPDPDMMAERLGVLHELNEKGGGPLVLVLVRASLDEDVPSPAGLREREFVLKVGERLDTGAFAERLEAAGYERAVQVIERGQFAVRGGMVDVFSLQSPLPVRLELFGDEIESMREFDINSQASVRRIGSGKIMLGEAEEKFCRMADYVGKGDAIVSIEGEEAAADAVPVTAPLPQARILAGAREIDGTEDFSTACHESPLGSFEAGDFVLQQAKRDTFIRQLHAWDAGGWQVRMFFNNEAEIERFSELIGAEGAARRPKVACLVGTLDHGFTIPSAEIAVLSDAELFGRYQQVKARRLFNREKRSQARRAQDDFRELNEEDVVVHLDYGIARFEGLMEMEDGGRKEEVLVLRFAEEAKLYVPLEQAHLVSRYVGAGKKAPPLNKLGSGRWAKTKAAAEKAIMDYAAQLLKVAAERETFKASAHAPDNKWQREFEGSFLYTETPDQLVAIHDTKVDMESDTPMDRLICGDVGFGKTEIAIRAAFKGVMGGRQVAVLTPTTVLAQQHFNTFRERMSDYPVTIELLSRFRTPKEQKAVIERLAAGDVDIVVGTHRLISKDIRFKDVGLVVIDEEQRFGVKHKERFKEMFRLVDVLTLSATPIPRTLYLSLMGVKDMSTIDTPPPNRYPVETTVGMYDERVIKGAIDRELRRGGQVFFLHNRVDSIDEMARTIHELCPEARVAVGHGQMEEGMLELVMHRFIQGEIDVFVCTTIIESGIDIPNANTIIIDRADRFGLADLYQLRGRVGRAQHKAYAFLLLPPGMMTVGDARKRINAIKQYTSLGAGFKIAMRDLEIRGAGNLLGTQQSGHIVAVGFELYCKLLKQSVASLRGEAAGKRIEVALDLDFLCSNEALYLKSPDGMLPAYIPVDYMPEPRLRISAYRMLAELSTPKELKALVASWRDRFGRFPEPVENLLRCAELRLAAAAVRVSIVEIRGDRLMLVRNGDYVLIGGKFPRLGGDSPENRLQRAVDMVKKF